jgi:hypothetical protein
MTVACPLCLLHSPYGRGAAHMAVVRPLWPWYGHYGCGAAAVAVVPLLWPSFSPSGPIHELAMLPAAAALDSFCHQDSGGHQSRMDRQPRGL